MPVLMLLVNDRAEALRPQTARIAEELCNIGLNVYITDTRHIDMSPLRSPRAHCIRFGTPQEESVPVTDSVALWVRMNPYRSKNASAEVHHALDFAFTVEHWGVPVVNPPAALARTLTKVTTMRLPGAHPATRISSDAMELSAAVERAGCLCLAKPAAGTGGTGVAVCFPGGESTYATLKEMAKGGPVVVAPLLPDTPLGVERSTVCRGEVLTLDGRSAVIRRTPPHGLPAQLATDPRPGILDCGSAASRRAHELAPLLGEMGLVHAGIDTIGGFLLEVNVWSPGGLLELEAETGMPFTRELVEQVMAWARTRAASLENR